MTNQELLIMALSDEFDDGGAIRETVIDENIACPYKRGDDRARCHGISNFINRSNCTKCKEKWLESEVKDEV